VKFYRLRFRFRARGRIRFPAGKPATILRGALGTALRLVACVPECPGTRDCDLRQSCAYARIFEPAAGTPSPSGLADWPRPFVLRVRHLDGVTVEPGEAFHFDLHLFALDPELPGYLTLAFAEIGRQGLGPGRGRADFCRAEHLDLSDRLVARVFESGGELLRPPGAATHIALEPAISAPGRVRVDFLTPTELKFAKGIAAEPAFGILFARVRDRVSMLSALYGSGTLKVDFKAMGERAALVRMVRSEVHTVEAHRRSSRTGQVHPVSGFVGSADYEGDLAEFLPYLEAARWTGVGRQTAFGKGEIAVTPAG
jgi:hypothetical protein